MMKITTLVALLAVGLMAGCVPQQTVNANPYPPVPPPLEEKMPLPPVAAEELVWQPGHWDWSGKSYEWAGGQYVPAAGHGQRWMPGWWSRTPAGDWVWQPPHWTS